MSSLSRRSSIAVSLALTALLAWACTGGSGGASIGTSGSTGNASSSGGTDPIVSPAECTPQCVQKATACQAPADIAQQRCASFCANSITQSQVACLMSSSCEDLSELESDADVETLCPKGGSNCATGQVCACTRGDLECVGDKCTCTSGITPSSGLCWPQ